jgi:plasmid stability protein
MAELVLRNVDSALVSRLKERADTHCRSVEEEHKAILREALAANKQEGGEVTFEGYLRQMPDVGADADFSRIEGSMNDVSLSD